MAIPSARRYIPVISNHPKKNGGNQLAWPMGRNVIMRIGPDAIK
jgi:hypothetical protein